MSRLPLFPSSPQPETIRVHLGACFLVTVPFFPEFSEFDAAYIAGAVGYRTASARGMVFPCQVTTGTEASKKTFDFPDDHEGIQAARADAAERAIPCEYVYLSRHVDHAYRAAWDSARKAAELAGVPIYDVQQVLAKRLQDPSAGLPSPAALEAYDAFAVALHALSAARESSPIILPSQR